jgi:hypothetical protein
MEVCNFVFDFIGAHSSEFVLGLRGDIGLDLLRNAGTIKTLGTLEDVPN